MVPKNVGTCKSLNSGAAAMMMTGGSVTRGRCSSVLMIVGTVVAILSGSVEAASFRTPSCTVIPRGGGEGNSGVEETLCFVTKGVNDTSKSGRAGLSGGGYAVSGSPRMSSVSDKRWMTENGGASVSAPSGRVRNGLPGSRSLSLNGKVAVDSEVYESLDNEKEVKKRTLKNKGPLKVLFLSSDTGGGHRASAESLAKQFQIHYPGTKYELADVWSPTNVFPYKMLVNTYKHLSAHPRQWKFLFHFTNTKAWMIWTDFHTQLTCEKKIRAQIEAYNPDVVVSVHPTMNYSPLVSTRIISKQKNKYIPFYTVVTDFGSAHRTWFERGVDKIFVASERIRKLSIKQGKMPQEKIVQSGLPIRHDFAVHSDKMGSDRTSAHAIKYQKLIRKNLGIDSETKMVLVMGGGEGVGSLSSIVDSLYVTFSKLGINATIAVVCGRNENLKQDLENKDWPLLISQLSRVKRRRHFHKLRWMVPSKRIRDSLKRMNKAAKEGDLNPKHIHGNVRIMPLGFVSEMAEFMVASDVLVSKAGPGTIAEAAALGLPIMLTSFLPGQEAGNVNIVLEGGFGDFCDEPWRISEEVACWLRDKPLLDIMSQAAMKTGVPHAAKDIVIQIGDETHACIERNNASN